MIKRMPLKEYSIGKASMEELTSTYYDTPDFWLKRHGVSLRLRHTNCGWVQTLKTCDMPRSGLYQRGEWECPVEDQAFDFIALRIMVGPHKGLKKLLHNELALNAIFTTRVTRTTWNLELPAGDKIELSLDQGSIEHEDFTEAIAEVELEQKSGNPVHLFDCALQLADAIPLKVGNLSKSARGYALCMPPHSIEAITAGTFNLQKRTTVDEGSKAIVADCVRQIEGNSAILIQGTNQESLHQMRIGLRRLQSALALFKRFSPPPDGVKDELAWLAAKLGPDRDWEVFSNSTLGIVQVPASEDAGIAHLRSAATDSAAVKREQAISAVKSVRFTRLVLSLGRWLAFAFRNEPGKRQLKHKLGDPLSRFAAARISTEQRRLHRCHKDLRDELTNSRHKFRIATKNLRYTIEFFRTLYSKKAVDDYLRKLAALQDEFGLDNDRIIAEGFLLRLAAKKKNLVPSIGLVRGFLLAKNTAVNSNLWEHLISIDLQMKK